MASVDFFKPLKILKSLRSKKPSNLSRQASNFKNFFLDLKYLNIFYFKFQRFLFVYIFEFNLKLVGHFRFIYGNFNEKLTFATRMAVTHLSSSSTFSQHNILIARSPLTPGGALGDRRANVKSVGALFFFFQLIPL